MNNQEVYDKVKEHLLSQNLRSINPIGECLYRGENGAMCAVGVLIPDDMYYSSFESQSCDSEAIRYVLNKFKIDVKFVCKLQIIHDSLSTCMWPKALENVATEYGLKP